MKRFNIDELIWFIILCFLNISLIYLIKSNEIKNFVDEDVIKYFYISIGILLLFSIYQFERIFTLRRRIEITNKFIPITFTLVIGVILLFVIPLYSDNSLDIINGMEEKYKGIISINNENYNIIDQAMEDKSIYNEKLIVFLGYVNCGQNNEIIISRDIITCCQADKRRVNIRVNGINTKLKEGQWVVIVGKASIKDEFVVDIIEYKLVNQPKDIYFHQHL